MTRRSGFYFLLLVIICGMLVFELSDALREKLVERRPQGTVEAHRPPQEGHSKSRRTRSARPSAVREEATWPVGEPIRLTGTRFSPDMTELSLDFSRDLNQQLDVEKLKIDISFYQAGVDGRTPVPWRDEIEIDWGHFAGSADHAPRLAMGFKSLQKFDDYDLNVTYDGRSLSRD